MKTKLINIGTAQGIRIPKTLVEQCNLEGELNIELRNRELVIKTKENPRHGWEEAFKKATSKKESAKIDGDGMNLSSWDETEWEW